MKQIYFIRHGESEGNLNPDYKGENPLSENGQNQAEIVSEKFKEVPLELIIATSKKRSQQTAEVIGSKVKVPIEENNLFLERIGDFEKTWAYRHLSPSDMSKEIRGKFHLPNWETNPNEENFSSLLERAEKALNFLEQIPQEKVAIVTHGGFLKFLTAYIIFRDKLNEDLASQFMLHTGTSNTGITIFKFNPKDKHWRMISWNDHGHLGAIHLNLGVARLTEKEGGK